MLRVITVPTSRGLVTVKLETKMVEGGLERAVNICLDGHDVSSKRFVCQLPAGVHFASVSIWQKYQSARQGNLVVRSGFGLGGCYDQYDPKAPLDPRHIESDTEHASGCLEILKCLQWFYPDLLARGCFERAEVLMRHHDAGEIAYGDRPDDGSQNLAEKSIVELTEIAMIATLLPGEAQSQLVKDFVGFQEPLNPYPPREDMEMFQLARAIDKLETVLSAVAYEKAGAGGDLRYKERYYGGLTEQDREFIRETGGDSSIVATWLAHVVRDYHMYYGFPYVLDVVRAAVIDVRGEWFPWFDGFCENHKIPQDHVRHPLLAK